MKCNGRREHYLLELGGTGCPIGSIRLHEEGVIVVLFHPSAVALGLQRWHVGSDVHHPGATLIYLTVPRDFYGHIDGSSITRQR